MATIEERAKRLRGTCEFLKDEFSDGYEKGLHDGYIIGAHKQKSIDIDKACEWLKDNIHKDLTIGTYADTLESLINDFRKAMEE